VVLPRIHLEMINSPTLPRGGRGRRGMKASACAASDCTNTARPKGGEAIGRWRRRPAVIAARALRHRPAIGPGVAPPRRISARAFMVHHYKGCTGATVPAGWSSYVQGSSVAGLWHNAHVVPFSLPESAGLHAGGRCPTNFFTTGGSAPRSPAATGPQARCAGSGSPATTRSRSLDGPRRAFGDAIGRARWSPRHRS